MSERRVLIKSFAPRYRRSRKKVKSELLTEFTEMSGYNRCYAAYLLRHQGRRIRLRGKVVTVAEATKRVRRQRARKKLIEEGTEAFRSVRKARDIHSSGLWEVGRATKLTVFSPDFQRRRKGSNPSLAIFRKYAMFVPYGSGLFDLVRNRVK